ncbi:MAG: glycosyltransferase family 2 protein [Thermoanaerobaculales bacterium]|nr:glycosyltransferase family 2 protein [Thermoanaerobaculales bacterium]
MNGVIGAVVVSFNSGEDLPACLEALLSAEAVRKIVVVDNASADDSRRVVRSFEDPKLELLALDVNTGFAGGCNRGYAALGNEVDVVASVNPDVVVAADCLSRAADALIGDERLAGVAPRLMRRDGETVDSVGQVLSRVALEVRDRGYGSRLCPELAAPVHVLAACGALAVYRRGALERVAGDHGPWAECYFCFWEDLELGWRLVNQGFRFESLPAAVAVHGRGAGAAEGSGPLRWRRPVELEACVLSNRWMTLLRHLHTLDLIGRLPLLLTWDLALVAAGVIRRPGLAAAVMRRLPLVMRQWRARADGPRRRLRDLPW